MLLAHQLVTKYGPVEVVHDVRLPHEEKNEVECEFDDDAVQELEECPDVAAGQEVDESIQISSACSSSPIFVLPCVSTVSSNKF